MPLTFSTRTPDFFEPHDVINLNDASSRIDEYSQATLDQFFGGVAPSEFASSSYLIELLDPDLINELTDDTQHTILSVATMGFTTADAAFTSGSASGVPQFGIGEVIEGIEEFEVDEAGPVTSDTDILIIEIDPENFIGIQTGVDAPGTVISDYNGPTPAVIYVPPDDGDIQDELDDEIADPPAVYVLGGVRIVSVNTVDGGTATSPITVTARIFLAVRDI